MNFYHTLQSSWRNRWRRSTAFCSVSEATTFTRHMGGRYWRGTIVPARKWYPYRPVCCSGCEERRGNYHHRHSLDELVAKQTHSFTCDTRSSLLCGARDSFFRGSGNFRGWKLSWLALSHENNENWHRTKITRYTVYTLLTLVS